VVFPQHIKYRDDDGNLDADSVREFWKANYKEPLWAKPVRLLIDAADDDGGDEVRGPIWKHIEECRKLLGNEENDMELRTLRLLAAAFDVNITEAEARTRELGLHD